METNKTNVMSQEELEEMYADIGMTEEEFDRIIVESFRQIENGQTRTVEEFWAELDVIMEKDLQDEYNKLHTTTKGEIIMEEKTNVMSQEELNELYEETGLTHEDFIQMLIDGEESRKNGTFRPAEDVFNDLERKYQEKLARLNEELYFKKAV